MVGHKSSEKIYMCDNNTIYSNVNFGTVLAVAAKHRLLFHEERGKLASQLPAGVFQAARWYFNDIAMGYLEK